MGIVKEFRDFITGIAYTDAFGGMFGQTNATAAGVAINEMSAMQSAAVAGCVRIISGTLARLPINIYEINPDDQSERTVSYDHDLYYMLNTQPNPFTDAFIFKETLQIHLLLTGNAYIEMVMDKGGRLAALYQRNPMNTGPTIDRTTGELMFLTTDGGSGQQRVIAANRMVHLKGMSLDGLLGMNPIRTYAKEVIGADIAAGQFGARLFANGASPSGIISTDKSLKPDTRKQLETSWKSGHTGTNAHKFAVLDSGLKWQQTSLSPEESQFLQTRGFSRDQIATIYGVPPHMLGDSRSEKSSNMEQQMLQLLNTTLKPWLSRWENALAVKLLPVVGRNAGLYQIGFDVSDLECADYASKLNAISVGRQWGVFTSNEGRRKLGMNPYNDKSKDAADQLWQPVNMVVAQEKEDEPAAPAVPPVPATALTAAPTEAEPKPTAETKGVSIHSRYFNEAFTRCLKREKRDLSTIQRTFSPSLFGLCDYFAMSATNEFRAGDDLPTAVNDFVADYMGSMLKRASEWTATSSTVEFDRAVKALRLVVYREAAIQKAKNEEVM